MTRQAEFANGLHAHSPSPAHSTPLSYTSSPPVPIRAAITRPLTAEELSLSDVSQEYHPSQEGQGRQDDGKGITIEARGLKRYSNKRHVLLNDVSLVIPSNSLVGVVGKSGTGKSTLIDALNGLRPAQEGTVLYDGQDYYRNLTVFRTQIGYVPQEDTTHRDLTVERALYYAAKLRLPSSYSEAQIKQRVDEVLQALGIAQRRSLAVGKLSGGQRKRVAIAAELLARPRLFFLDEPTSGLDPDLDRKMMHLLRTLADQGHTVVVTTHATANIDVCDYICFLAEGGRLAYFGPPAEARHYFGTDDFTAIYTKLEPTSEDPCAAEVAEALFKTSCQYQQYVAQPLERLQSRHEGKEASSATRDVLKRSGPGRQLLLLTMRSLELLKNNTTTLLILLLQAPIIGLILLGIVKYEIGTNIFDANSIVRCPTTAQILTPAGYIDTPTPLHPIVSTNCHRVERFLNEQPSGKAYASDHGGTGKALQDFIASGPGIDSQKVLFILAFTVVMFSCTNAIREIVKEQAIYRHERSVNLGIFPYVLSKILVLGTLCLLQSAILLAMLNIYQPFHQGILWPANIEAFITLSLTSLSGMMLGLAISAAVPTNDSAMGFIPIVLVPQVIFSGTIFPLKDYISQAMGMLFAARWGMIALGSSVGLHSDKLMNDKLFGNDYTYHSVLFSTYSQHDAIRHLLLVWTALATMCLIFGIALSILLRLKDLRR